MTLVKKKQKRHNLTVTVITNNLLERVGYQQLLSPPKSDDFYFLCWFWCGAIQGCKSIHLHDLRSIKLRLIPIAKTCQLHWEWMGSSLDAGHYLRQIEADLTLSSLGTALRSSAYSDAILHIRCHRHAGKMVFPLCCLFFCVFLSSSWLVSHLCGPCPCLPLLPFSSHTLMASPSISQSVVLSHLWVVSVPESPV